MPDHASSHRYLHGHHESVLRSHSRRTVENSAAYLVPRLRPDSRVLDVGCGLGTITAGLARLVPGGSVVGVDAEPDIVARARAEAAGSATAGSVAGSVGAGSAAGANLSFETGDVYHLDHGDASFDVVHAHQVLQHLSDPVAALVEMGRVCRPGGVVACRDSDFGGMFWYPASDAMTGWRSLYRSVARSAGGEPDAARHLVGWAHAAGFSEVEASGSVWCFATAGDRRWWGGLWAERVVQSRFADQAVGAGLASPDDLERAAEGWRAWTIAEDACFFVPHGEVLCTP